MVPSNGYGGKSGNAGENLEGWKVVMSQPVYSSTVQYQTYTTGALNSNLNWQQNVVAQPTPYPSAYSPNRIFQPIQPVNRIVHPDDHIAWLTGRTRAVCAKLSWSKAS